MTPQDCIRALLDATRTTAQKNETLTTYINEWIADMPPVFTKKTAMRWALRDLRGATPQDQHAPLDATLVILARHQREQRNTFLQERVAVLRRLSNGTKVVIALNNSERELTFQAMRRTRFLATDHRGELLSVAAHLFVRVAASSPAEVEHATNN